MKLRNIFTLILSGALMALVLSGCFKDLDTIPLDEDVVTSGVVYDDPSAYEKVLAKVYAGLAVSGQQGPAGQADIEGIDEGFGQYLRGYWYHQELCTDEAVIGWNDQTIKDFHDMDWTSGDGFIFAFYSRIFYQVVLCNEFLRETTDAKVNGRGQSSLLPEIHGYRAEVRFLRALSYWHALDLFRNVPFVTEEDAVGAFFPEQIQAADLFEYIESELLAIENDIAAPKTNPYGRADRAASWMLLAKLYLNAEVYTGTPHYTECLAVCKKILNSGYELDPEYQNLFLADNNTSPEIIFPITFDGVSTRTYGGTTFIIFGGIGGSMSPAASGVSGGWAGTRATKQFIQKFPEDIGGIITVPNAGVNHKKLYVPGAYQGWNASNTNTSISETFTNSKIFEGHVYFPTDNSPFFFTTVPSFALRLGDNGGDGTLEMNGDTIRVPTAGLYYIQVNRNTETYVLEKRDWGIAGDATPGGWDVDQDLVWNDSTKALEINIDLTEGDFKFRANDDWAVNLGDNNKDALLTYDGANIHIKSGSYLIRLFIGKLDYTYEILSTSFDTRGLFYTQGQDIEINDLTIFTDGYAVNKFKNITSDGVNGSDTDYPDTDFPMFRLADAYLMASEAILRGAQGGTRQEGLDYFNVVRSRAYGSAAGGISDANYNLQTMIDERAREFYWECQRRTDLIRFNQFTTSDYLWAWKGGVKEGQAVEPFRRVYPIPAQDRGANPNLVQNEGY